MQELTSNVVVIEKLQNYQYKDKNQKDFGENVRHRAKQLSELILDTDRIREERKKVRTAPQSLYPLRACIDYTAVDKRVHSSCSGNWVQIVGILNVSPSVLEALSCTMHSGGDMIIAGITAGLLPYVQCQAEIRGQHNGWSMCALTHLHSNA